MSPPKNNLLLLVGPTAVGKTEFSLHLAQRLQGEIVSADSRQIYRYMDIGTAKPTIQQREQIRHHFVDVVDPDAYFSAGEYGRQSRRVIDALFRKGCVPIVVGGSGLYIRALVDGFFDPFVHDNEVRENLQRRMKEWGPKPLHAELMTIDPETAGRIHPNDTQRILRALEVHEITGRPLSLIQRESRGVMPAFEPLFIGLTMSRPVLYERIDRRVDDMMKKGLVDEVQNLVTMGYDRTLNAMQTVGYQEVFSYLGGEVDLEEAVRLVKRNSRHYAKRQLTWFSKDRRVTWFDVKEDESIDSIIDRILDVYTTAGKRK
ncbi:MAG: tRNA (adenosine(37)-N6)-dimethylallyltransferase MiaA [Gemmatimonadota bacterium]|nr:MAG: tRNA (adenosine(37)-N6)-dimethylallyltransferase MiaA [Gemmatimonadota bacterium]